MLKSGDICQAELGPPFGSEAGFKRPVVIVTAQKILSHQPQVVHVVPLTTTIRNYTTEVTLEPDPENLLTSISAAQCQHIRAISSARIGATNGNIGEVALSQIRELIGLILDT